MNTEMLIQSLILMGKGMLGIFIVIIAIMAVVAILTRITSGPQKGGETGK